MKCRQCGNGFHNGLVCPLCGHKNIGLAHCPVCGKGIHYGQEHCPSCGTPTPYYKKVEVVVKGDIIDYTTHSEESHTYDSKEPYDYKKDAYQHNQESVKKDNTVPSWMDMIKQKQAQMQTTARSNPLYSTKITGATGNIIVGIVILVLLVVFCISAIFLQ